MSRTLCGLSATPIRTSPAYERPQTARYSSPSEKRAGSWSSAAASAARWLAAAAARVASHGRSTRTGLCIRPLTYSVLQWRRSSRSVAARITPYLSSRPRTRTSGL